MKTIHLPFLLFLLSASAVAGTAGFTVDATYVGRIVALPTDEGAVTVYIPLPTSTPHQTVSNVIIDSPLPWRHGRDEQFGNAYAYTILRTPPKELEVRVRFRVTRNEVRFTETKLAAPERHELARNLGANRLMPLSPKIKALAAQVTKGKNGSLEKARAIYDHVLATMSYDKSVPGWGRGDAERACDIGKGNCTDFHSLFISLARAEGIPARFVIGFPLTAADGQAKGYHCWAEFYVEGRGWIPVDASDAAKSSDRAVREYLFGNLDARRIELTRGRDLVLHPRTEPINYFLAPYAEVNGLEAGIASSELTFSVVE